MRWDSALAKSIHSALSQSLRLMMVLAILVAVGASAYAQATFGNVRGVVKDETGAVVAGAKVTISDKRTNTSFTTQSSGDGVYQFNNLLPGEYQINVEADGFKTLALTGVKVDLNQTTDVPTTLSVGGAGEIVEVSASGSELVETTTTTLSKSFDSRQTVELAQTAAGGGIYNLALIAPNVSSGGGVGVGSGGSIGGQRPRNNNFTVDGIDNNDKSVTGPQIYISPETVSEFTLLANQFSAEFGRSNGGQFITVTKSGTNEYHGTAYSFFQNRFLNALDTLQKNAGVVRERSAVRSNPNLSFLPRSDFSRYGGNVGGPIVKDKLFFFTSYEGQQTGAASAPGGLTAPTAEGIAVLSTLRGLSQNNFAIFRQFVPVSPSAIGNIQVTDGGRTLNVPVGNIFFDAPSFSNQRNFVLNFDFNQSEKSQHRTRFIFDRIRAIDTGANLPAFFTNTPTNGRLFSYTFLHSFNPNLTTETRFAFRRNENRLVTPNIQFPGLDQFPNIGLLDLALEIGPNGVAPQFGIENNYQLVQNVSYTRGNHSFKFGFDGRRLISPQSFVQRQRGDYQYQSTDRFLRDLNPDFLAERTVGTSPYFGNQTLLYFYGQDDWRITPNLTLNYGLRYEYQQLPFGARQQSLNSAASVPGLIEFREPEADLNNFAPKIGLAYAPNGGKNKITKFLFGSENGQSSIRAGFSLGYDYIFDNLYILSLPPQFNQTRNVDTVVDIPNFLASGGIPPTPNPITNDPRTLRRLTSSFIPDQKVPYSITYTLAYQRQFLNDWSVEFRYLGTRGINLITQNRLNVVPRVTQNASLPTFMSTPSVAALRNLTLSLRDLTSRPVFSNEFGAAGFNAQNLVAFTPNGNSNYQSFSTSLQRRFSQGLSLNLAYTLSHLIDDSTAELFSTVLSPRRPQDFQNFQAEKANSALDSRHRFVVSGIYDLPFFNRSSNRLMKSLLGGFSVAATATYESGKNATPLSGIDSNLNLDPAGDRTIRNGSGVRNTASGVIALDRNGNQVAFNNPNTVAYVALNPNAEYIQAGPGAFANAGRNTLRLPAIENFDISIFKNFAITETIKMQFRADFFNAFNHAQYVPGSVNGTNPINTTAVGRVNTVTSRDFNRPERVFSSNPRVIQLALRLNF